MRMVGRIHRLLEPYGIAARYVLLGAKRERNSWIESSDETLQMYRELMDADWERTERDHPEYARRLRASLEPASGRTLEIGCGIGNMSRWLAAKESVTEVVACDLHPRAIGILKEYRLPKIRPVLSTADDLNAGNDSFDTVLLCELLEHLYPDEERKLRRQLRPLVRPDTRYVISVPVGWMPEKTHVRAFSRRRFARHLSRHYGVAETIDYSSGYSQVGSGACERLAGAG